MKFNLLERLHFDDLKVLFKISSIIYITYILFYFCKRANS